MHWAQRYDEFQREAVQNIVDDYKAKPNGRYLLSVPTGGGKTITAVKSINALFDQGVYDAGKHRVLWVAHRDYLINQASDGFSNYEEWYPEENSYRECVVTKMLGDAVETLEKDKNIALVIIDEAHHAAAKSYLPLFEPPHVGVLGLTATPSRHDGKPLEFERESYSIGFPDLVDRGVILRPDVHRFDTGITFEGVTDVDAQLDQFDSMQRNQKVIDAILKKREEYKKVVIYVGTVKHVESLFSQMKKSELSDHYESISYIVGGDRNNNRSLPRDEFLAKERAIKRSIIVNVDVLTEGYDDPSVNTIVMARPTKSKLVYMQAMGRGIRHDPDDPLKKAFVVELEDDLPNIRYRINNRWLYADVSDALEPNVIDRKFSSAVTFRERLMEIYDQFNVDESLREYPEFQERDRFALLLFKVYKGPEDSRHIPILMSNDNRLKVTAFFNFLSERVPYLVKERINTDAAFGKVQYSEIPVLCDKSNRARVFEAMQNSVDFDAVKTDLRPWITYVSLTHRKETDQLSADVKMFLADMVNAEQIEAQIISSDFPEGTCLARFPLPLGSFIGKVIFDAEVTSLEKCLAQLREMQASLCEEDHRQAVDAMINQQQLPLEYGLVKTLPTIVREQIQFTAQI